MTDRDEGTFDYARLAEHYDRTEVLLDQLANRVPPAELEQLHEFLEVGEPGELFDNLAALFIKEQLPVSREEYDELAALVKCISVDDHPFLRPDMLARLNVAPNESPAS